MRHIKLSYFLIFTSLCVHGEPNKHIENYFLKILENEKLEFLDCIDREGLILKQQINTMCEVSNLASDAFFYLHDKNRATPYDFLDQFDKPIATHKPKVSYPRNPQQRGIEGYAIVKFDLNKDGKAINEEIIEGRCGKMRQPFAKLKDCNHFYKPALNAAKRIKYKPAQFEEKNIQINGMLHRFSFILEEGPIEIKRNKKKEYLKASEALKNNDFQKTIEISQANVKYDYIFMHQISNANHHKGNHIEAKEWANRFQNKLIEEGRDMPEYIVVESYIILISSLFSLGEHYQIIELEDEFNAYLKERSLFDELLAMTNFYFGVSYINTGNIHKGAYYLGLAAKKSNSKEQSDYINSVIDQISSYL
jgi:hypothetical protein